MVLDFVEWGPEAGEAVVCVHGVAQRGSIFERLARRLAGAGRRVVVPDLRGHGESPAEPPWGLTTHVEDLLETAAAAGVGEASWIGHSFGGRLCAALADDAPERVKRLALLEPAFDVPAERVRQAVAIERLDWSFATVDGATQALLSAQTTVGAPAEVVAGYVRDDVRPDESGRFRFSHSSEAALAAWEEMARPAPAVAAIPTLLLHASGSHLDREAAENRYHRVLGGLLTTATVPGGHNVLWSAAGEADSLVEGFLTAAPAPGGKAAPTAPVKGDFP